MRMGFLVGIELIFVVGVHNCKGNWIKFDIFVVCLLVGFKSNEVDSPIMRIANVLHKLQHVSNHVFINCDATKHFSKSIYYVHVDIYY
jgi:hypothetical protein